MSEDFKLPEQVKLAGRARTLLEIGVDQDVVLGVLRKGGLSKVDSIKLLGGLTGMHLMQAKKLIDNSRAWQHNFAKDAEFQELIAEATQALEADEIV